MAPPIRLEVSRVGYDPRRVRVGGSELDDSLLIRLSEAVYRAETLVVTGTRTLRDVEDVPVPDSVIPGERIRQAGQMRLSDVISNGAAFATAVALVLTGPLAMTEWFHGAVMPMAAFIGGVVSTLVVYRLSTTDGRTHVATLTGAGIGYLVFLADDNQIRDLTFWLLGSLGGAQWSTVLTVAPFLLAAVFWLPGLARGLNAMLLGESEAAHLGFRVERLKKVIILLVGLSVGAAVSVSGVIGFVGLVVPHILRLWIGPDHRFLVPGSALLGALLLLGSDLAARTLAAPAEIPIGVITASVGAPFFLWLLMTDKMRGEG